MNEVNLPDFDELYTLIGEIKDKAIDVAKLKLKIKVLEKGVFVKGREDGLPVSHIENSYKHTGFKDEIMPYRLDLAEMEATLNWMENTLSLHRSKIEVWRTVSANERSGIA